MKLKPKTSTSAVCRLPFRGSRGACWQILVVLALILTLTFLTTCEKPERDNPWDDKANLDPDEWAPANLTIQDITITSKKLSWAYNNTENIEGFKIDRKDGNNTWQEAYIVLAKETKEWTDVEIVPDLNRRYEYRVYTFAGNNKSAGITITTTGAIDAPSSISVTINSISSLTLNWQDNCVGETGFKVDRQTNEGEWQQVFATLGANQTSYTDNTVNMVNTYTYRVYAYFGNYNSAYTGMQVLPPLPIVTTAAVSGITGITAVSGGIVISRIGFPVSARGVVWGTSQNPTIESNLGITSDGLGTGTFTSSLTGLQSGTNYYVRAYATNSVGTQYGNEQTFTTSMPDGPGSNITDADGNVYNTIWINGRQWMKENLRTTKYNNGTSISLVTDNATWAGLSTPAYCWYNNDQTTYGNTYGALYNWYAVNTGNLCPTGWHVPTDAEWTVLTDYVGGASVAGTKLKATSGWYSDGNGTDEYGFSALPGGYRSNSNGHFHNVGYYGTWWSSTEYGATYAWYRGMSYVNGIVSRFDDYKRYGFSVRCVRDN